MPRLRWPIAACLALVVVGSGAGVASFLSSQGASPYKAMLAVSDRLVALRGESQADYAQVHGDGVVNPGDALRTDERGTALLTYYDGSTVALSPLTELVVERLEGVELRTLYLSVGRVAITVNKLLSEGSRYEVRTPSAAISVRGTRFIITVTPDGRTDVDVSEGRVELGAAGEKLALGAGEGGVVEGPGRRPQKKGVAVSPSPTVPPPPSPPVVVQARIVLDKPVADLGERVSYCLEGYGAMSSLERVSVVYPDGTERTQGWARTYPDVNQLCRAWSFDPQPIPYPQGAYTFKWLVNGVPASFTVTLQGPRAAAQATPTPIPTTPPTVAAPVPVPAPRVPSNCTPNVSGEPSTIVPGQRHQLLYRCFVPLTAIQWVGTTHPDGRYIAQPNPTTLIISTGLAPRFSGPVGEAHFNMIFPLTWTGLAGTYVYRTVTDQGVVYEVPFTLVK